jgi:hypothetical protein
MPSTFVTGINPDNWQEHYCNLVLEILGMAETHSNYKDRIYI